MKRQGQMISFAYGISISKKGPKALILFLPTAVACKAKVTIHVIP